MDKEMEQSLRKRFNPEGSVLRREQKRMLDLLLVLDGICRKHRIPYWLSSGTLIGAVRHKGFIPWDDDLDVEFMRKDYLKLLRILPLELPGNMAVQSRDTDPAYTQVYAKLRDLDSCIKEPHDFDRGFRYNGIFIDLFPMERAPYSLAWFGARMHGQVYGILQTGKLSEKVRTRLASWWYASDRHLVFPFLRLLSACSFSRTLRHSFGTGFFAPRRMEEIFPLSQVEFEGHLFSAPHDTDAYLRRIYDNYMELPPLDRIPAHIKDIRFGGSDTL